MVQPDSAKPATLMHVETYFQMNYETGLPTRSYQILLKQKDYQKN